MLRIIIFILSFLSIGELYGQTIGYGFKYGLPYSISQSGYTNFEFKKSPVIGLVLGLNSANKVINQTELSFLTYATHLRTTDNFLGASSTYDISLRKYQIELQTFFLNLDLRKLGKIYIGSKLSYVFSSSVEGQFIFPNGQIDVIESFEYERESKFGAFLSLRYSVGTISLGNGFKLFPSYTFNYSRKKEFPLYFTGQQNHSHTFGLMIIKDLKPKTRL